MLQAGDRITITEYEQMLARINDLLYSRVGDGLPEEESLTGNLRLYVQDEEGERQNIEFIDGDVESGGYIKAYGTTQEYDWQDGYTRGINFLIDEVSIINTANLPSKVHYGDYITPTEYNTLDSIITEYENTPVKSSTNTCSGKCSGLCIATCFDICTSCTDECAVSCTDDCRDVCNSSCSNTCSGGCLTGCSSCKGGCKDNCYGSCKDTCKGGCDSCTGSCYKTCSGCKGTCTGTCSTSCRNDCYTGCFGTQN